MTWQTIVRKEFSDAIRSLVLWIVSGVFVLFGVLLVGSYIILQEEFSPPDADPGTALDAMVFVLSPIALVAPIVALIVGYKAIVGERESGSLKVLLSLPHTRWDVMFGKLIGRTLVVVVPLIIALVVMASLISVFVEPIGLIEYLTVFVISILFASVFVAIAVAISGATRSSTVAGAAMFGVYVLFMLFWDLINLGLLYLAEGRLTPQPEPPSWYLLFDMLSPDGAYLIAAQGLLPEIDLYGGLFPEDVPWYLSEWAALLILLVWLVIPFAIGFYRFDRSDL